MGIFIAFALGVLSAVYAPKAVHRAEVSVAETASAGYIKISDVRCPSCLLTKQKSKSMVLNVRDDLKKVETDYRCIPHGHEWTVIRDAVEGEKR